MYQNIVFKSAVCHPPFFVFSPLKNAKTPTHHRLQHPLPCQLWRCHFRILSTKITLHCYEYGREHSTELNKYCEHVFYYKRNMSPVNLLKKQPFIVVSRNDKSLLKRLLENDAPILYEGIHTCATLSHPSLKSRLKIIRTHNIEADYYLNLANLENNFLKKIYFNIESKKLRNFEEKTLQHADHILAISPNDTTWFRERFENVHYVPAFHPNEEVDILAGRGKYTLFHGDLSVKDNANAAFFLIKNIFTKIKTPFIIAGLNPPDTLIHEVKKHAHITLKINVSQAEMNDLIQQAHINLLYTFHSSGMKLKLLNALYRGRFCVVNSAMVQNTGMETLCHVANTSNDLIRAIREVQCLDFTKNLIEKRRQSLNNKFSNLTNAQITYNLISVLLLYCFTVLLY